jgi:hypothetical protein
MAAERHRQNDSAFVIERMLERPDEHDCLSPR